MNAPAVCPGGLFQAYSKDKSNTYTFKHFLKAKLFLEGNTTLIVFLKSLSESVTGVFIDQYLISPQQYQV